MAGDQGAAILNRMEELGIEVPKLEHGGNGNGRDESAIPRGDARGGLNSSTAHPQQKETARARRSEAARGNPRERAFPSPIRYAVEQ